MPEPFRKLTAAVGAVGTRLRRVADHMKTPTDDGQTTIVGTCDASAIGPFDLHFGPCILRNQHDGPLHRGPGGETWATVVRHVEDEPTTPCDGAVEAQQPDAR